MLSLGVRVDKVTSLVHDPRYPAAVLPPCPLMHPTLVREPFHRDRCV